MPRDGSNIYSKPAGTTAVSGTTIESAKYNSVIDDLVTDANTARPIVAGGTGAATAAAALVNLGVTATAAQINPVGQFAGRNLILNGSGRINQRAYVSGTATVGANQYTLDQWRVVTSGQSLTFTGTVAGQTMTAPAGGVEQVIAGANIVGGTYVINWTGTATCTVDGVARTKGATFTLTANTNATIRFTGGTFTEVQLERGALVTPYEWIPRGSEQILCMAHYQQIRVWSRWTAAGASELDGRVTMFPVPMRATPTIALTTVTTSTNVTPTVTLAQISLQLQTLAIASGVVEYLVLYALTAEL